MRPRTVLISLLIIASVLVDLAALEFAGQHGDSPAAKALLASLAVSQTALVSLWAGLGHTWIYVRLTAALGVCWLWSRIIVTEPVMFATGVIQIRDAWLVALAFESWLIVASLWIGRANGMQWVDAANRGAVVEPRQNRPPQFRIVDFFGVTFVLGVLLAMFQHLAGAYMIDADWRLLLLDVAAVVHFLAVMATVCGLTMLLGWLLLRRNEPFHRLAVLAASLAVGGALGFVSISSEAEPLLGSLMLFISTTTLLLVGSLIVIRIAGYRLATVRTARQSAADRIASSALAAS